MIRRRLLSIALVVAVSPLAVLCQKITKESLTSEDKKRNFYLYVPATLKADTPVPLVILLHGSSHVGLSLAEKWKGLANKEGFIIAAPDSVDSAYWSTPADGPPFLRDLVDAMKARYPINPRRVYLFGHSGGAGFGLLMGLYESEYFAAVAVHAGALNENGVELLKIAKRKTPVHIQVGDRDPLFPLSIVRSTRDAFKKSDFPVELKEIANHDHWYYDRASEINSRAWDFLKVHELANPPVYEAHNFRKDSRASKQSAAAVTHYNKGLERLRAGDSQAAVVAFTKVLELDANDADAYNNRAIAYTSLRNYEAALADLSRSIEIKPSDAAYSNRAGVYFALKKIDEAIADFSEALKIKPSAEIYADRGLGYSQRGKDELALADYEQAIRLNPKFGRSYLLRGLLFLNKGDSDTAQKDFDVGFQLDPKLHAEFDPIIQQIRSIRGIK